MIRRARADESGPIAALYDRSYSTLTFLPRRHTLEEHTSYMARHVAEDDVWVWDDEGEILGFTILRGDDELFHIHVEPSQTGRGIGTALLDHAKGELPQGFSLWTFQQNAGARRFYERHGLRAIAFGDGSGNEEGVPDVQYEWRPTSPGAARAR